MQDGNGLGVVVMPCVDAPPGNTLPPGSGAACAVRWAYQGAACPHNACCDLPSFVYLSSEIVPVPQVVPNATLPCLTSDSTNDCTALTARPGPARAPAGYPRCAPQQPCQRLSV